MLFRKFFFFFFERRSELAVWFYRCLNVNVLSASSVSLSLSWSVLVVGLRMLVLLRLSTASRKASELIRDYYRKFNSLDCFAAKCCWDSWAWSWPSQSIWLRPGVAFLCDEGMRCAVLASVGGVLNMNLSSWAAWPGF